MNETQLTEASEDDFREFVWARIRVKGRYSLIEALIHEDDDASVLEEENEIVGGADAYMSDDSDESGNEVDGDYDIDDDNESIDSIEDNGGRLRVHDQIVHDHVHCPPFPDMSSTFRGIPCGVCDCDDFCLAQCFQENDFEFLKLSEYPMNFDELFLLAVEGIDNERRRPNNEIRKYYYKKLFMALDFGALEKGERRRLPNCGVAKIRQLHPSEDGFYMGFKEN